MEGTYFLQSARLQFRTWRKEDIGLAQQLWGDPRVTALIAGAMSAEQVEERLRREIAQEKAFGVQYWPVLWRDSGEFVGCCGLKPYKDIYEMGFHLRPEFWGRGVGEESGRTVIGYAFDTLRAPALFAGHHPENRASRRVLEKLGFVYTHDEVYPPTGMMHPGYRLTRSSSSVNSIEL